MTAPSESAPQPVPGLPGWAWWRGKDGHPCARRPGMPVVQAPNWTVLLARIRRAEGNGMTVPVDKASLNAARDDLERAFPAREVWWLPELSLGEGLRVTWHSRVRGEQNADVHGDSAEHLAEHIELADADAAAAKRAGTVRYEESQE